MKVETLILLFRPITVPPPISAAPPFSNVGPSHSFPAPIMEQGFQPSKRLPPPEESYISGLHYGHVLPIHDRSKQVVPSPHFHQNELGTHVAWVQSPVQPYQVVQRPAFPHHHPAEPHQPYLPEKPFISPQNAYRRYIPFFLILTLGNNLTCLSVLSFKHFILICTVISSEY